MKPTGLMDEGKKASIELVREILLVVFQLRTYEYMMLSLLLLLAFFGGVLGCQHSHFCVFNKSWIIWIVFTERLLDPIMNSDQHILLILGPCQCTLLLIVWILLLCILQAALSGTGLHFGLTQQKDPCHLLAKVLV